MRNVILAVVAIAALTAAGVGGVFADFSDIETSEDNYFKTGSLDLKVSNAQGKEFDDPNVPVFWEIKDAWPECDKSIWLDLENWGQGFQKTPWLYIHFKNFECGWVMPKYVEGVYEPKWIDCVDGVCVEVEPPDTLPVSGYQGTGLPKPVTEPEYVAECGGIAGELEDGTPVTVPGIGCCYGEDCQLAKHIGVMISMAGPWPHADKPAYDEVPAGDWTVVYSGKLDKLNCKEFELGQLENCNGVWLHMSLYLQDIDEDDLGFHYFDEDIPCEAKWDCWPTNAIQKDYVHFDIAFELLQTQYVP